MRIGVIVDGQAESQALWPLIQSIDLDNNQFLKPVYADMQPKASPKQIARAALSRVKIQQSRGADFIAVLIDLEDRIECPGVFASSVRNAFCDMGILNIEVVIKKYCFENWLIADPGAFKKTPKRFNITDKFENLVSPNKADHVNNGAKLINSICKGKKAYHKREDPMIIAKNSSPEVVAANSRSFRRFLRVIGFSKYESQSISP